MCSLQVSKLLLCCFFWNMCSFYASRLLQVLTICLLTPEGNGNPLLYPCLENPMGGAWSATVHGVAKSWT